MTQRFPSAAVDPFRPFIHSKPKPGHSLKDCYNEKVHLGYFAELKDAHLITGLIGVLSAHM
ncbi:hypothetical protein HPB50_004668 [Hyalomma asiaticum]|uniref:Uncharacterized protein n=1 Tax=Hyalomma asiaticum TaxID=266040 RepID=A0ACB7RJ26_HYAAI|nr:hypothetical protein HPB50_004668 [Hyalomma asiaticum]